MSNTKGRLWCHSDVTTSEEEGPHLSTPRHIKGTTCSTPSPTPSPFPRGTPQSPASETEPVGSRARAVGGKEPGAPNTGISPSPRCVFSLLLRTPEQDKESGSP